MKSALFALAFASVLFGQSVPINSPAVYTANRSTVGTTEKVTIQQPASGSRRVRLVSAYVYCSSGCDVTQSRNGTAATSTALATTTVNPGDAGTSSALAFHTSNVGAGTSIFPTVTVSAGAAEKAFDLSGIVLTGDGTGINYTIAVTASTSSTLRVAVKWVEE